MTHCGPHRCQSRRFTKWLEAESLVGITLEYATLDVREYFLFLAFGKLSNSEGSLPLPKFSSSLPRNASSEPEAGFQPKLSVSYASKPSKQKIIRTDTRCILTSTMRRFRKKLSSPSTPINRQPSTPTPPAEHTKEELATFHPRAKDQKTLAASSSAIASPTASASCNPSDIALDELGSSKESAWKTAYGAARIAIETIKESSDLFLPLKAVVGALSVLIKNYDVRFFQLPYPPDR